jgi:tape measure domain-containing protein
MKGIKGAASLEETTIAFRVLVGDVGRADAALRGIKDLAATTPFEFPELADAGRKLVAFGQSAEAVPGTLRMIGDIASGVGAPVGDLAELFGKAQVAGTLYAEDINQLVGRGIPIMEDFASQLGVGVDEVKKMASEGKLTFSMLEKAFQNLTGDGGRFNGMMAKMAETTTGRMSTLKDAVNEVLVEFGKPVNDAINPILTAATTHVEGLKGALASLGEATGTGISRAFAAVQTGTFGDWIKSELVVAGMEFGNKVGEGLNGAYNRFASFMNEAIPGFGQLFKGALLDAGNSFAAFLIEKSGFAAANLVEAVEKATGTNLGSATLRGKSARTATEMLMGGNAEGIEATKAGKSIFKRLIEGAAGGAMFSDAEMGAAKADRDVRRGALDLVRQDASAEARFAAAEKEIEAARELSKAKPEGFKPVMPALPTGTTGPTSGALGTDFSAVGPGESGGEGGEYGPGRRRIRLKGAAESALARAGRMSAADRAKIGGPGAFGGVAGFTPGEALANGSQLARGAAANLGGGNSLAAAKGKAKEEQPRDLLSILKKIEENTAAFANVAVA